VTSARGGIHVRLSPGVEALLREEARARVVSVSLLVGFLIEDGLDRLIPVAELRERRELPPRNPRPLVEVLADPEVEDRLRGEPLARGLSPSLRSPRCDLCRGYACAEGCFPRCDHAYAGPDSHEVCNRCKGSGVRT
jgi:hypothetical protein